MPQNLEVSSNTFDKSDESSHSCLAPDLRSPLVFSIQDVNCWLVVYGFYYVVSGPDLLRGFYHEGMLNFIKNLF